MARLLPVLSFTLRWTTADSTSHQNQSDALNVSRDYAPRAVHEKGHVTLVRLWMGSAMERRVPCSSSSEPECKKARKERAIRCLSERPRPRGSDAGLGEGASRGVAEVVAPPFASRVRMNLKPRRRRSRLADVCLWQARAALRLCTAFLEGAMLGLAGCTRPGRGTRESASTTRDRGMLASASARHDHNKGGVVAFSHAQCTFE